MSIICLDVLYLVTSLHLHISTRASQALGLHYLRHTNI